MSVESHRYRCAGSASSGFDPYRGLPSPSGVATTYWRGLHNRKDQKPDYRAGDHDCDRERHQRRRLDPANRVLRRSLGPRATCSGDRVQAPSLRHRGSGPRGALVFRLRSRVRRTLDAGEDAGAHVLLSSLDRSNRSLFIRAIGSRPQFDPLERITRWAYSQKGCPEALSSRPLIPEQRLSRASRSASRSRSAPLRSALSTRFSSWYGS